MKYMTPNFTQLDDWQRCPTLIVLKEEKKQRQQQPMLSCGLTGRVMQCPAIFGRTRL